MLYRAMGDWDQVDDLNAMQAELDSLKKALGADYRHLNASLESEDEEAFVNVPETSRQPTRRPISPKTKVECIQAALTANVQLQERLNRLMNSIERAQDKAQDLKDQTHAALSKQRQAEAVKSMAPTLKSSAPSGQSWFWSAAMPNHSPPPNQDYESVASVLRLLPLSFPKTLWTDDERARLRDSVLVLTQEKGLNNILNSMEERVSKGEGIAFSDIELASAPIKELTEDSPEVEAAATNFTVGDWTTVATRAGLSRTPLDCKLQWTNSQRPSLSKTPFTKTEEEELLKAVGEEKGKDGVSAGDRLWTRVAERLHNERAPIACLRRYIALQVSSQRNAASAREFVKQFRDEDYVKLKDLVAKHGSAWKHIAAEFGDGWEAMQLMHHWRRLEQRQALGAVPKRGKWSAEEDEMLQKSVALHGRKWSKVAKLVPGRTDVQCRERFVNVLDPSVKTYASFSQEEDERLIQLVEEHTAVTGTVRWSAVAAELAGRTDKQCAVHYASLQGKLGHKKKLKRKQQKKKVCGRDASGAVDDHVSSLPLGSSSSRYGRERKRGKHMNDFYYTD